MSFRQRIITIDGPSGVGKSSVSRKIASVLGCTYLDTGAMYRGLALYFHRLNIAVDNEAAIRPRLGEVHLTLFPAPLAQSDVGVVLNGEDVSTFIRTPAISMAASKISALPHVRDYLTELQRKIAASGNVVAEGRDMGTVVFPQAAFKFFLDAEASVRSKRRCQQLRQNGLEADEEEILKQTLERDEQDRTRAVAPLKKAADAHYIDTTDLSLEQVCERILGTITRKTSEKNWFSGD